MVRRALRGTTGTHYDRRWYNGDFDRWPRPVSIRRGIRVRRQPVEHRNLASESDFSRGRRPESQQRCLSHDDEECDDRVSAAPRQFPKTNRQRSRRKLMVRRTLRQSRPHEHVRPTYRVCYSRWWWAVRNYCRSGWRPLVHCGDRIARMTTAGAVTEFTVSSGSTPRAIVAAPDGNLYFAEFGSGKIAQITTAGVVTEVTIPTPNSGPVGLAAGADGNIWFTESNANKIGKISLR